MSEMAVLGNNKGVLFTSADGSILFPQGVPVDETKAKEIEGILTGQKVLVRYIRHNEKKSRPVIAIEKLEGGKMKHVRGMGTPLGALVAFLTKEGEIRFGWSKRHVGHEPIPFSKKMAKRVAICRALAESTFKTKNGVMVMHDLSPVPRRIAKEIPSFVERAQKYFKRIEVVNFNKTDKVYEAKAKRGAGFV